MDDPLKSVQVKYQELVPGSSYRSPAPIGLTVKTSVERGNVYLQPTLYNVLITVKEVVRGKEALARLEAQGITSKPSKGDDYILVRIVFDYFPRGKGSKSADYTLMKGEFSVISKDGKEYEIPQITQPPQPSLVDHTFSPVSNYEGWLLFQVPKDEKEPLLIFKREHTEGAYSIWGYVWFQLY